MEPYLLQENNNLTTDHPFSLLFYVLVFYILVIIIHFILIICFIVCSVHQITFKLVNIYIAF